MKKIFLLITIVIILTSLLYADGPAYVDLGTAENYVIMAKTAITTTGTTSITGNLAISPAAASNATGFGLTMDSSGEFSTSPLITGQFFAADYSPPTPSNLTTAVGDMQTAYTDAAGRVTPDHTELYSGDLTSQTLVPGLYKWSSGVMINGAGVEISGSAEDVWIFQIAGNLTVASDAIVTLSGGAQAQNIFWQVAGETNVGTDAQFKGVILCQTAIHLNTGASFVGRLLAQTAVTLISNEVVRPSDQTLPVELSSFTALNHSGEYVTLNWVTHSESNLYGYNVYRSENDDLVTAMRVNPSVVLANNETITSTYSYTDKEIEPATYYYWLEVSEFSNENSFHGPIVVTVENDDPDVPELSYTEFRNFGPSPFTESTSSTLRVKEGETATITIYNLLGQVVSRESFKSGEHKFIFNGKDLNNKNVANGIYFVNMNTESVTKFIKIVKIK